jgi:hypothetical protein
MPGRFNQDFIVRTLHLKKHQCAEEQIDAFGGSKIDFQGRSDVIIGRLYHNGFILAMIRRIHITGLMTVGPAACLATGVRRSEQGKVIYLAVAIMQIEGKPGGRHQDQTGKYEMENLPVHVNFSLPGTK